MRVNSYSAAVLAADKARVEKKREKSAKPAGSDKKPSSTKKPS